MRVPSTKTMMGMLAVLSLLVSVNPVEANMGNDGVITFHSREVLMTEPDVVHFENRFQFSPGKSNQHGRKTIFEYIVAADYADTLVALDVINQDTKYNMNVTRSNYPLDFNENESQYNSTDFIWFQIDMSEHFDQGEDDIRMVVNEYHKRKREAFPSRLSLLEEQTMQLSDSRYLLSPYLVVATQTVYRFNEGTVEEFT